jgi:hypothetical protein
MLVFPTDGSPSVITLKVGILGIKELSGRDVVGVGERNFF